MLYSEPKGRIRFAIPRALLASVALTGLLAGSALCQQESPKPRPIPPPGPLLNPVPNFSEWTITFSYGQDKKQKGGSAKMVPLDPAAPRKVVTTKTANIIHEKTWSTGGASFEIWQVDRTIYTKPHGQAYWGESDENTMQDTRGIQGNSLVVPASGFRDLDWINAGAYAGSVQQGNSVYLVFVSPGSDDMDFSDPAKLAAQTRIAYVDTATRLPVYLRIDDVVRSYAFSPPPTSMQILPADLAKEIQEGNEKRSKLFAAPVREY